MRSLLPPRPEAHPDQCGRGELPLRYEDISQDGKIRLETIATAESVSTWQATLMKHPAVPQLLARGIVPIMTRLCIEGTDGPFAVETSLDCDGCYEISHSVSAAGSVDRLFLNVWANAHAPLGRTVLPPPANAGERRLAGRVFAEHVFTRPLAPREQRRVTVDDLIAFEEVPGPRFEQCIGPTLLRFEGDDEQASLEMDPHEICFGMRHTDSNQHVNSLVYITLFEEAAVRHLARRGGSPQVMGRAIEIAYRKPFFAGDRMQIAVSTRTIGDAVHAVGALFASGADMADVSRAH